MATTSDTATQLMTFAAGPSLAGTAALLAYARSVLQGREREPRKGWLALGAGVLLTVWLAVFLVWAAPTVLRSWGAGGEPEVPLVLLSATWFVAMGLVAVIVATAPQIARYLAESYHDDEGPWLVRWMRKVLGRARR